jgi:pimeloyl-ACP methyl ester carboxylesterase
MFEQIKAGLIFNVLMRRHNIDNAYKMVGPEDSWYDTITKVHNSLAEIKQLPHENWTITSHDGLSLKAVFYPGTTNKTMIWIHGYTSHAERESAFPGLFYHSMGYNVLVPYLRAHGHSEGKYISFGPMEALDMQRWIEQVNIKHPDGSILIHGLSMGGGVALDLATMELKNVKCILADAPSYSIPEFFNGVTRANFKKNPDKLIDCLHQRFRKEFSVDAADYDRRETIKEGKYPLLLAAGSMEEQDEVFSLLKARNPQPTTVVILPGCNHGNGMYKQTQMYQDAIREFVGQYM